MRLSKRRRETMAVMDMTPMIDIVFLLLIFFMTVSQVSEINKERRIELPELKGSVDQKPTEMIVNVDENGQMIVAARPVELGEVVTLVSQELLRAGDDPEKITVVIRADHRSIARPVNQLMSALREMRVAKVRLAVKTQGG